MKAINQVVTIKNLFIGLPVFSFGFSTVICHEKKYCNQRNRDLS